ncbi:MAG: PEP-CTERM sorting domain-containing protein, partial [Myxococcota bacterium]
SSTDPFAPLAARALVAQLDREHRSGALASLDGLHDVAKRHHVVTPYSSMLVLVNAEQLQRLQELEQQGDRFEREITDAQAQMTEVSAVPEPGVWGLAALAALGAVAGRRFRKPSVG